MGRILSVDVGQKRTGLAVTDPLQIIANGLETIPSAEAIDYIKKYTEKENVDEIVVGYPTQMNNTASESVKYINPFLKKLCKVLPEIKITQYDERFTSKMAFQTMIDGGLKKKQRQNKALIDKISATIILQSYLEHKNNSLK